MADSTTASRHAGVAQKAEGIYKRDIEATTRPEQLGSYVLIDVDSGDFEIDRDELAAADRLRQRRPEARLWMRRVGSRFGRRFGFRRMAAE